MALRLDKQIGKFSSKYLDVRTVLVMDTFLSVSASAVVAFVGTLTESFFTAGVRYWLVWMLAAAVSSVVMFMAMRTYAIIIRHTTFKDILKFVTALAGKEAMVFVSMLAFVGMDGVLLGMLLADLLFSLLLLVGVRLGMISAYDLYKSKVRELQKCRRVLVYGTSDKTESAISRFRNSPHYDLIGVISPDSSLKYAKFSNKSVYYFKDAKDLDKLALSLSVTGVLFTRKEDARLENERLVKYCFDLGLKVLFVPEVNELGEDRGVGIRDVKIEDLLGRDEIKVSMDEIKSGFAGKTVMVTGAAGSIGSELCRQLATFGIAKLLLFDNAETPVHNLRLELEDTFPKLDFVPIIGDVRSSRRLEYAFRRFHPDVVFHAAAYKHVPLMEENPCEAVLVNFVGTSYVADKCIEYGVEKMVMISTDKAVNPTNVMGCSKRLAEIYVQSLGLAIEQGQHEGKTRFVTTRFGNVLGSNGSVIPRFREQIRKGGPVTVTHPEITRFFMTIPEACRLVMEAVIMDTANRICVFDMGEPVKIDTLARRMIELSGLVVDRDIKIEYTGLRPGEKLYEEVLSNVENTEPTKHGRIRVAKVRTYPFNEAQEAVQKLGDLARAVDIPAMVKLMKQVVPEFISKNSRFSEYDAK